MHIEVDINNRKHPVLRTSTFSEVTPGQQAWNKCLGHSALEAEVGVRCSARGLASAWGGSLGTAALGRTQVPPHALVASTCGKTRNSTQGFRSLGWSITVIMRIVAAGHGLLRCFVPPLESLKRSSVS